MSFIGPFQYRCILSRVLYVEGSNRLAVKNSTQGLQGTEVTKGYFEVLDKRSPLKPVHSFKLRLEKQMIMTIIQSFLFATSIALCIFHFPATNGQNSTVSPIGKEPQGTNSPQPLGKSNLNNRASPIKSTKVTPTASTNLSPVASFQLPVGEAGVKRHVSKNSSWRKSRRSRNNVVRSRRRHGQRRKGWVAARRRTRRSSQRGNRKGSISDNGTSTYTAKNESIFHGSNATKNVTTSKMKNHPCNSVHSPEMKFKVGNMECRRWQKNDLKKRMNCMGNFNHQYLATSFQKALQFKDLDTDKNMDFRKSLVLNHRQSFHNRKRNPDIDPGETLIVKCHGRKTVTESGHLRICPVCAAITRQPSTPKRFPEYINELLCDPQMEFNYLPRINAFCVQKTFTIKLLQFDGDWELNSALSAEAGHDVYTEKWEDYTQKIRHHCACELLPSSPMADLL